jgi:hypothetical protein
MFAGTLVAFFGYLIPLIEPDPSQDPNQDRNQDRNQEPNQQPTQESRQQTEETGTAPGPGGQERRH